MSPSGLSLIFHQLAISSSKVAIAVTKKDFRILKTTLKHAPKLLKQETYTYMFGIGVYKHNFMFKLTYEVMEKLIQTGIHRYFMKYIMDYYFYDRIEERGPQVFSIDDLHFGFVIWLAACGVAVGAFGCEVLWYYLNKWIRALMVKIVMLKLLILRLRILAL